MNTIPLKWLCCLAGPSFVDMRLCEANICYLTQFKAETEASGAVQSLLFEMAAFAF